MNNQNGLNLSSNIKISDYVTLIIIFLVSLNLSDDEKINKFILNLLLVLTSGYIKKEIASIHLINAFRNNKKGLLDIISAIPLIKIDEFKSLPFQFVKVNIVPNDNSDTTSINFTSDGFNTDSKELDNCSILHSKVDYLTYTLFIKDPIKEILIPEPLKLTLQNLLRDMNTWVGSINFLSEANRSIVIEENSNNLDRFTIKTISESISLKAKINPFSVQSTGITEVSNEVILITFTKVIDINKGGDLSVYYSADINYEIEKNRISLNPKAGTYGTVIDTLHNQFQIIENVFQLLNTMLVL